MFSSFGELLICLAADKMSFSVLGVFLLPNSIQFQGWTVSPSMYFSPRVGCASCSGGKRARAPRTARCGRTCPPSAGSWRYRRPNETRFMKTSQDSSTTTDSTPSCTSLTSRYTYAASNPGFWWSCRIYSESLVFLSFYDKNTQTLSTTVQPCVSKRHKSKCFYKWENQRVILWCTERRREREKKKSFLCLPQPVWSHHLLLSAAFVFVMFVPHKSLKIEVVNDQPTHFLLNTPPSHPLPETKMLSSLA